MLLMTAACLVLGSATRTFAWDNGVALTPPRGFSTWNAFPVHSIDEATCYKYMNALVAAGLNKLNYTYFVVDEPCFAGRDTDGNLIENKTTWPNGLKAFGEALRSHGMKLGTYTCVGPTTCGGCIASEGHEEQDVATFAEWGVEYLKVDSCSRNCTPAAGVPNASECGQTLWKRYTDAIKKHPTVSGTDMVFSIIGNLAPGRGPETPPWKWAADFANSWRTNIDIQIGWQAVPNIVSNQRKLSGNGSWCPSTSDPNGPGFPCASDGPCKTCGGPNNFSGIGHWNDMDMLIVGTKTNTNPPFCSDPSNCTNGARPMHWIPLTVGQSRAHVSMWAILKSPMLASADFTNVSVDLINVLSNEEILAVSDDPLGQEAIRLGDSGQQVLSEGEIYVGPLVNNGYAIVFFNREGSNANMTFVISDLKTKGQWAVRDLWAHTNNGTVSWSDQIKVTVPGEDAVAISLKPV